jgi:hypothetical protein
MCDYKLGKDSLYARYQEVKDPNKYAKNLRMRVQKDGKLRKLKSHDYHILMQQVLPLCFCNLM